MTLQFYLNTKVLSFNMKNYEGSISGNIYTYYITQKTDIDYLFSCIYLSDKFKLNKYQFYKLKHFIKTNLFLSENYPNDVLRLNFNEFKKEMKTIQNNTIVKNIIL